MSSREKTESLRSLINMFGVGDEDPWPRKVPGRVRVKALATHLSCFCNYHSLIPQLEGT